MRISQTPHSTIIDRIPASHKTASNENQAAAHLPVPSTMLRRVSLVPAKDACVRPVAHNYFTRQGLFDVECDARETNPLITDTIELHCCTVELFAHPVPLSACWRVADIPFLVPLVQQLPAPRQTRQGFRV